MNIPKRKWLGCFRAFGNKYLAATIISAVLFTNICSAQLQDINAFGYNWNAGQFRQVLNPPRRGDSLFAANYRNVLQQGSFYWDTATQKQMRFYNNSWHLETSGGGSGSGNPNTKIGGGQWLVDGSTNNVKTLFGANGIVIDSATNANALTFNIGTITGGAIWNGVPIADAQIASQAAWNAKVSSVLPSAQIPVGSNTNVYTPRTLSGDGTLNNTGVLQIVGLRGNVLPALAPGKLVWTGTALAWVGSPGMDTIHITNQGAAGLTLLKTSPTFDSLLFPRFLNSTTIGWVKNSDSGVSANSLLSGSTGNVSISGANVTLKNDNLAPGNSKIYMTHASTGVVGWYDFSTIPAATLSVPGLFSTAEKLRLDSNVYYINNHCSGCDTIVYASPTRDTIYFKPIKLTSTGATVTITDNTVQGHIEYNLESSGGSGGSNLNAGSGYRLAIPGTNNIKTLTCSGCTLDSATSNQIGITVGSSLTRQTITSGSSGTASPSKVSILFNPSSLIAAYTLTLPASPSDMDVVFIDFGGTITVGTVITSFTVIPNSGQTILDNTPLTAVLMVVDDHAEYRYIAATSQWKRIKY